MRGKQKRQVVTRTHELSETFVDNIHYLMKKRGLTHTDVAEKLGQNRSWVSAILARSNPTMQTVVKFALVLDVDPVKLLTPRRKR